MYFLLCSFIVLFSVLLEYYIFSLILSLFISFITIYYKS